MLTVNSTVKCTMIILIKRIKMKTETFKIIDIDTALEMMKTMNNELVLKVVGNYYND